MWVSTEHDSTLPNARLPREGEGQELVLLSYHIPAVATPMAGDLLPGLPGPVSSPGSAGNRHRECKTAAFCANGLPLLSDLPFAPFLLIN